jgi:SET domain-containing protein
MFLYSLYGFSIDATDNERLGRYINDEPKKSKACNCIAKTIKINDRHHICLFASRAILCGEEIRYDYGGGSALPWRKVRIFRLLYYTSVLVIMLSSSL